MTPLLEVRDLSFSYDASHPVLHDAHLAVATGRRLAVVGPNGGGKTTLFRLLVGALAPDRGSIRLDGVPLRRDRRSLLSLRQQVQLVLSSPDDQLFAASVFQDVSFGPVNLGLPQDEVHDRVGAALRALNLEDLADRPTHLLSFGQRKRAAIAGAVAMRPRLLILDEPTAGLDPAGVEALLEILATLHAAGTTLILSTHDVDLAQRWADDVAVVADRTVTVAPAAQALADGELLSRASLTLAWAPLVGQLLDRVDGLRGTRPTTPAELAKLLDR
ncbi:MAG: ABC transporter ATP-binding protein [Micromonosporaceae bacterium]|nr:ABC transporter ATP-binding protein [Micromonosporaceae bacterium]